MRFVIKLAVLLIITIMPTIRILTSSAQEPVSFSFEDLSSADKVAWSHSGAYLAVLGEGKEDIYRTEVFIWDMSTQELVKIISGLEKDPRNSLEPEPQDLVWTYDDQFIIVAGEEISVWWVETGEKQIVLADGANCGDFLSLSPAGEYLAVLNCDPDVKIWNTQTWQLEKVVPKGSESTPNDVFNPLIWHPFEPKIALYNPEQGLVIIDIESDTRQVLGLVQPRGGLDVKINIETLAWSPNGDYIIGSGLIFSDETFIWNIQTGQQRQIAFLSQQLRWHPKTNLIAKCKAPEN